ncbi:YopX family protein [Clostridium botulinum]|uniref:YopX family protein n=1 Tax=Clostridium botulinum TaxID=1491 RepID=UPI001E4F3887|nr:YopX family protein [Clostridium botulinum]MCD3277472.1 hypothetical protein [Clostridium botulinum C/D]MCD3289241.1 hypothetical protein [Clostridium botulinum C/D]MCD3292074.1 hypothetical protein [Clostridium botulinum C/D]MCD3303809.1 hypothetical protein [Clostridium botulinum C/D]
MKAKDLTLRVVNEIEQGKFEIKEVKPYMAYESFIGCILGDAEILRDTGLKDKTGKEIYECDIVVYHDFPEEDWIDDSYISGEVKFVGAKFLVTGELEDELIELHDDVKVIGNIYQNKELLDFAKVNDVCRKLEDM